VPHHPNRDQTLPYNGCPRQGTTQKPLAMTLPKESGAREYRKCRPSSTTNGANRRGKSCSSNAHRPNNHVPEFRRLAYPSVFFHFMNSHGWMIPLQHISAEELVWLFRVPRPLWVSKGADLDSTATGIVELDGAEKHHPCKRRKAGAPQI